MNDVHDSSGFHICFVMLLAMFRARICTIQRLDMTVLASCRDWLVIIYDSGEIVINLLGKPAMYYNLTCGDSQIEPIV